MKVGIDARLLERRMTGVGRYLSNIVRYLSGEGYHNEYILYTQDSLINQFSDNVCNTTVSSGIPRRFSRLRSAFWYHVILPEVLRRDKIDVFLAPNAILPLGNTGAKNIVVIHDVFQMINKNFHPFVFRIYASFFLRRAIRKADKVITVSEASKRDIVKFLKISETMVCVIYEAADERFSPRDISHMDRARLCAKYSLPSEFIFYVGVIEERKNIACILEVADRMQDKFFVLAGRIGYRGNIYAKEIGRRDNMRHIDFVEEEDLPLLYNLASVFFFPSYYEGFGLPPLEAMQSGVPVVASNISSLPEVVGDGGILLSPDDTLGFVEAISKILRDKERREHLIRSGFAQAKKFSWGKTALDTLEIMERE